MRCAALVAVCGLLLFACGGNGEASEEAIQTAIAETEEAATKMQAAVDTAVAETAAAASATAEAEVEAQPTETVMLTATAALQVGEIATVTRVIDGDTIEVEMGGRTYDVRYIGINTPESNQTCGGEASQANSSLVEGQEVVLVKDVSEVDQYGRLLRYVYVGDTFVNAELVAQGYAEAVQYPPDVAHADDFGNLEMLAEANDLGCHPSGVFAAIAAGASEPVGAPTSAPQATTAVEPTAAEPPTQAPASTSAPPPTEAAAPTEKPNPWPGCPEITCGGFGSCGAVMEYLSYCPQYWGARDGDGDGVPCESLCG